jgi:hypothetical protein
LTLVLPLLWIGFRAPSFMRCHRRAVLIRSEAAEMCSCASIETGSRFAAELIAKGFQCGADFCDRLGPCDASRQISAWAVLLLIGRTVSHTPDCPRIDLILLRMETARTDLWAGLGTQCLPASKRPSNAGEASPARSQRRHHFLSMMVCARARPVVGEWVGRKPWGCRYMWMARFSTASAASLTASVSVGWA